MKTKICVLSLLLILGLVSNFLFKVYKARKHGYSVADAIVRIENDERILEEVGRITSSNILEHAFDHSSNTLNFLIEIEGIKASKTYKVKSTRDINGGWKDIYD